MKFVISTDLMKSGDSCSDFSLICAVSDTAGWAKQVGAPASLIPAYARHLETLHCYIGQVRNGGHAQFVGNAGSGQKAADMLGHVIGLAGEIGLGPLAAIASEARDWVRAHPDEADRQTGFQGGIAPALAALDAPFNALGDTLAVIAAWIRKQPEIHVVDKERVEEESRRINLEWIGATPQARAGVVRMHADRLRTWLADPVRVGLALAAGDGNRIRFANMRLFGPTGRSGSIVLNEATDADDILDSCLYDLSDRAMVVRFQMRIKGGGEGDSSDISVPMDKIERVQRLAQEFQMPESLGLRWPLSEPLDLRIVTLYEIPEWQPGKFWLRLLSTNWGLKGSPEKSTFYGPGTDEPESLSQEDIALMWNGLDRPN